MTNDTQDEYPAGTGPDPQRGWLRRLSGIAVKLALVLLALLLIFVAGIFLIDTVGIEGTRKAQSFLDSLFFPLFLWRLCLYALILTRWQTVMRFFARRGGWSEAELENAFKQYNRNLIIVFLLLFEVVVTGPFLLRVL